MFEFMKGKKKQAETDPKVLVLLVQFIIRVDFALLTFAQTSSCFQM